MKQIRIAGSVLCLLGAAATGRAQSIALVPYATGLSSVVHIANPGDGSARLFFVEQGGRLRVHDGTQLRTTPFLNIDPIVLGGGEEGLLSVAFHPNYETNGFFYVYYTNNSSNNVVARYQVSADPFLANPNSGTILLTLLHPGQGNHNGGQLQFGPDGFLYIATGDGGGGGDPDENAQDLSSFLGKQLRIDVNNGSPYGIPPGNPFVGVGGARPEIWSYGLRNPWRFSFDRQTGDMFIGDVGQNELEEVDFQPAGVSGRNYGWDDMEGSQCYEPSSGCLTANRVLPIIERDHDFGDCAIVGGYRYRGTAVPFLAGKYLHSDNCTGNIRVATETAPGVWSDSLGLDTGFGITSFGEDANGELYVSTGSTIQRIVGVPPATLSIGDRSVAENAGVASFTVAMSTSVSQQVTVQYSTTPGTATAGTDYTAASGTITFPPGTAARTISFQILNDALDEADETFTVTLASAINATLGDGVAQGTITDDDPLPNLDISDCAVTEGVAGLTPCTFTALLNPVSGRAVTVNYATAAGTATSGSDFTPASGILTLSAGATTAAVSVSVVGDAAIEVDEQFTLTLTGAVNATIGDGTGTGTIVDSDAPSLSTIELSHGAAVSVDLAGGTADLYRVFQPPSSSWEVVLDGISGDAVPGLVLERLASDNATVLQSAVATGSGPSLSMRWQNLLPVAVAAHHIRVRTPACGVSCGADDTYRLRLYETTLAGARFNNASGQGSVVFLQNPTRQPVTARVYFWSTSGTLLTSAGVTVAAQATHVMQVAQFAALAGQSGSFTVTHDGPYGTFGGKAVSLDPAGFSFDTPLRPLPR